MTVITTPECQQSNDVYNHMWEIWNKRSNYTFSYDLFYNLTMGNIYVASFIINYCTTSERSNFIIYLNNQGYSGDNLYHMIHDVCSGSYSEMDKLMLRLTNGNITTNELHILSSEHRKMRYL